MKEELTKLIAENLPTAITLIAISVIALVFIVWWAAKMWYKMNNLPCTDHESSICSHNGRIDSMTATLNRIEGRIDTLLLLIPQAASFKSQSLLSDDKPALAQKNSPKVLNTNGLKVASTFDCDAFLEVNKEWLIDEVSKFNPKTALDVEACSLAALRVASSDNRFNELKDKIYHSPMIELSISDTEYKNVEITLEDVLFVISLPLRDVYLEAHPEIK